jgi:hypothetical protein
MFILKKILHGTVGIKLENENKVYSPHNSKWSQKILKWSLRCSFSDVGVVAYCMRELHQEGVAERENRAVCVAHISQLPGVQQILSHNTVYTTTTVWILAKLGI